jgi:hypothetical protein
LKISIFLSLLFYHHWKSLNYINLTIVWAPILFCLIKIFIINGSVIIRTLIISNLSFSMKIILKPLSFVNKQQLLFLFIKLTMTMHKVIFPLPLIISSTCKIKTSISISHSIQNKTFISSTLTVLLDYILTFLSWSLEWLLFFVLFFWNSSMIV